MSILINIDKELEASKKEARGIHVCLFRQDDGTYKGLSKKVLSGDYLFRGESVQVKTVGDEFTVYGLEATDPELEGLLLQDKSAILKAVKKALQKEELDIKPSFIVGPPGTGKTAVITTAVKKSLENGLRILILSPTNMAVENVFERLDLSEFSDEDVALNIQTENKALESYTQAAMIANKRNLLQDELMALEAQLNELSRVKRDESLTLNSLSHEEENRVILENSLKNDLRDSERELKQLEATLAALIKRIASLSSNSLLSNISKLLNAKSSMKLEDLEAEKDALVKKLDNFDSATIALKQKIAKVSGFKSKELEEARAKMSQIDLAIALASNRIKEVKEEISNLLNYNFFKKAKLVGATLTSAALNKQLQTAGFDKIIIDEGSMALYPLIVSASQCLKEEPHASFDLESIESLTEAQNKGVSLICSSRLSVVGDPRQLSPIASTQEMRKTIFDLVRLVE